MADGRKEPAIQSLVTITFARSSLTPCDSSTFEMKMKAAILITLSIALIQSAYGKIYNFKNMAFEDALRQVVNDHNSQTTHKDGGKIHVFMDTNVDGDRKVNLVNMSLEDMTSHRLISLMCQQSGNLNVVKGNYFFILGVGEHELVSGVPEDLLPEIKIVCE